MRLSETTSLPAIENAVRLYLHEVLGILPTIQAWPGSETLPYYLHDTFQVRHLTWQDWSLLLAIDMRPGRQGLAIMRGQLDALRQQAGLPVVYVSGALASYERKRLIEHHMPFLVPGNQLYLPDLGIDLREYFIRRPAPRAAALSPATQALLLAALLRTPWHSEWQPAGMMQALGYTAMTLSRAVRELEAAGLCLVRTEGRTRWLHIDRGAADTWAYAQPLLRSPIRRRCWARPLPGWTAPQVRLTGLSALSRHSMLAEPQWPVYAVGPALWKTAAQAGFTPLPEPLPGAVEWEFWTYTPALTPDGDTVDPLSLTLSLQDRTDERVQLGLDALTRQFPW